MVQECSSVGNFQQMSDEEAEEDAHEIIDKVSRSISICWSQLALGSKVVSNGKGDFNHCNNQTRDAWVSSWWEGEKDMGDYNDKEGWSYSFEVTGFVIIGCKYVGSSSILCKYHGQECSDWNHNSIKLGFKPFFGFKGENKEDAKNNDSYCSEKNRTKKCHLLLTAVIEEDEGGH